MVWKMMMFEKMQDGCLVLGNGMILVISESLCCQMPSINFLLTRIYGWKMLFKEFHDGCLMLGPL